MKLDLQKAPANRAEYIRLLDYAIVFASQINEQVTQMGTFLEQNRMMVARLESSASAEESSHSLA